MDALRELGAELKLAAGAAVALALTLLLPWYEVTYSIQGGVRTETQHPLSPVEAALLLVSGGVLYLVWARSERKAFHLPGGDGTVVAAAGGWALLLVVYRMFDQPDVSGGNTSVGLQWGIFVAALAAGALVLAGARVRQIDRPEPPNPAAAEAPTRRMAREDGPESRVGARVAEREPEDKPFVPPQDRLF